MRVGIVGAGQLARMLLESASALGIDVVLLADSPDDGAVSSAHEVRIGSPTDPEALRSLCEEVDVLTFDHELVDLDALESLELDGHVIRPTPASLRFAVDKAAMRRLCESASLPAPTFRLVAPDDAVDLVEVGAELGWPMIIKTARGGYDGRGVFVSESPESAAALVAEIHLNGTVALLEERAEIRRELAVLVARRPGGQSVVWPAVETAQIDGVCREVLLPGSLEPVLSEAAAALATRIAEVIDLQGVLAVELFDTPAGLVVNELALRPHNSGHWTQDASGTSQFENHLRAVLDLPLGETALRAAAVASVNVFGGPEGARPLLDCLADALAVPGAHVHLYGKTTRPMRKLGHVTVTGEDAGVARRLAWQAAVALGTPVPSEIEERSA